ncbi:MAG: hypothetical protein WAM66_08120 [Acidobacteriaceae bacterium]
MKLRTRGDSLRFRLTRGEVSRLLAGDRVSESVHFSPAAGSVLKYSLQSSQDAAQMAASFGNGELHVDLPAALVGSWANTDQVGMEYAQPAGEGRKLQVVVEKDFRCLQPRPEEDEHDNFPNPESTAG